MDSFPLMINGEPTVTPEFQPVLNPAHKRQPVGHMPVATDEQVLRAIESATQALADWRATSPDARAAMIESCADAIEKELQELATLLSLENGKVLVEATSDVKGSVGLLRSTAALGRSFYEDQAARAEDGLRVHFDPIGVVGVITPWNSPLIIAIRDMAPALMAGCPVVIKPSSLAPLSTLRMVELMAGILPPGVINVLTGPADRIGNMMMAHPEVKMIAFTGSTDTGEQLLHSAAAHWKTMKMELGGNDPAIVLDDAVQQPHLMKRMINGIFRCSGQICFAIKRIYVQRRHFESFTDALVAALDQMIVGDGLDPEVSMGPLISQQQWDKVATLLRNAESYGAKVRPCGTLKERPDEGYYMLPHVLTDVSHSSEIVRVEQFGPLIPVIPFDHEDEAIAMANDTEYGLRSSIWSADLEKAANLAGRLQAGVTSINEFHAVRSRYDFKGWRKSGYGSWSSYGGVEEYLAIHGIAVHEA